MHRDRSHRLAREASRAHAELDNAGIPRRHEGRPLSLAERVDVALASVARMAAASSLEDSINKAIRVMGPSAAATSLESAATQIRLRGPHHAL